MKLPSKVSLPVWAWIMVAGFGLLLVFGFLLDLRQRYRAAPLVTAAATPAELDAAYRHALADSGGDGVVASSFRRSAMASMVLATSTGFAPSRNARAMLISGT